MKICIHPPQSPYSPTFQKQNPKNEVWNEELRGGGHMNNKFK
jgi:hypothetical protein